MTRSRKSQRETRPREQLHNFRIEFRDEKGAREIGNGWQFGASFGQCYVKAEVHKNRSEV